MTEREQAGLRGPVRVCELECDYVYPDHHWVMHTRDVYSREGNPLERTHRNPNGTEWSIVWRYDEAGRLRHREQQGEAPELYTYTYDALGRLERVMVGERAFESVRYGEDGTRTVTQYPGRMPPNTGVDIRVMLHLSADAVAVTTTFDAGGRTVRKVLYDADDRVVRRIGFVYDERGLLAEEGEAVGGNIREDFRNVYRHDTAGRRIEIDQRCGGWGRHRTVYAYNERGDVEEQRIEQELLMETAAWTERFRYIYDAGGNWTERVTETEREGAEPRMSMVERRVLDYF